MNHFAIHLKLTYYCKSTLLQEKRGVRSPLVAKQVKDPVWSQLWLGLIPDPGSSVWWGCDQKREGGFSEEMRNSPEWQIWQVYQKNVKGRDINIHMVLKTVSSLIQLIWEGQGWELWEMKLVRQKVQTGTICQGIQIFKQFTSFKEKNGSIIRRRPA